MRRVTVIIFVLSALCLTAGVVGAAFPQMDAGDDPVVEGPLTLVDTKCDRKRRTSDGRTVAVIKRCLRFYRFEPSSEGDPDDDYGVVWLQSNVDARNGWCTKRVASDVLLPSDAAVHRFKPQGSRQLATRRQMTTKLVSDAGGTASTPGSVSQEWTAFPSRVKGLFKEEGGIFRVKWSGTTDAKLAFAGGVEISWAPDSPPDGLSYQLNFALGSPDAC